MCTTDFSRDTTFIAGQLFFSPFAGKVLCAPSILAVTQLSLPTFCSLQSVMREDCVGHAIQLKCTSLCCSASYLTQVFTGHLLTHSLGQMLTWTKNPPPPPRVVGARRPITLAFSLQAPPPPPFPSAVKFLNKLEGSIAHPLTQAKSLLLFFLPCKISILCQFTVTTLFRFCTLLFLASLSRL